MALEFTIKGVQAPPAACIHTQTTEDKVSAVMGSLFGEIMTALQ
jgi:hypothetical protein